MYTDHMSNKLGRAVAHTLTNIRGYQYKQVKKFSGGKRSKKILELGSGPLVKGKYHYSTKHLFDESNEFIQSDIVKKFGHPIIDATTMKFKSKYDIIMCLNVLEHIYEYEKAVKNIHEALKPGGTAVISVPTFYPLHDEPGDYWRFTEHSLRKILSDFKKVTLTYKGKRQFPVCYYVEAKK